MEINVNVKQDILIIMEYVLNNVRKVSLLMRVETAIIAQFYKCLKMVSAFVKQIIKRIPMVSVKDNVLVVNI